MDIPLNEGGGLRAESRYLGGLSISASPADFDHLRAVQTEY
jgi:hypothetical protein